MEQNVSDIKEISPVYLGQSSEKAFPQRQTHKKLPVSKQRTPLIKDIEGTFKWEKGTIFWVSLSAAHFMAQTEGENVEPMTSISVSFNKEELLRMCIWLTPIF